MNRRKLLRTGIQGLFGISLFPSTAMAAYTATDFLPHDRPLRLCCNENPLGPSPIAKAAIVDALAQGNRYPRETLQSLKAAIAEANGLIPEQVYLAAGSFMILRQLGWWVHQQGKTVVGPDYTFDWLLRYAEQLGSPSIRVPLTVSQHLDLEKLEAAITPSTGLVYLCNPNNPTGTYWPQAKIHAFCRSVSSSTPVLIDEAYIEYLRVPPEENTARLLADFPKLMVCRTFSKIYGLAGLRVGYLLAAPAIVSFLEEWDVGANMAIGNTSAAAALASLQDSSFVDKAIATNQVSRAVLRRWLDRWEIPYSDAVANFEHVDVSRYDAVQLKEALVAAQVGIDPILRPAGTYLRISLGTTTELELFGERMDKFFSK